jgi:hypothetical protein
MHVFSPIGSFAYWLASHSSDLDLRFSSIDRLWKSFRVGWFDFPIHIAPRKRKQTDPDHADWDPRHCQACINWLKDKIADETQWWADTWERIRMNLTNDQRIVREFRLIQYLNRKHGQVQWSNLTDVSLSMSWWNSGTFEWTATTSTSRIPDW